jgi:hypothetical protein
VSALQPPAPIIQDVAVDVDVRKSRWYIALAISSDVQNQASTQFDQDTSNLEENVNTLTTSRWFTTNNLLSIYARRRH